MADSAAAAKRSGKRPARRRPDGELALIERIRGRAAAAGRSSRAVRLGIGDDCAILAPPPGHELLVTTDLSLEGRHFRRDWHPASAVGHRTLARGLSDLAAMGAQPMAAFLSLALPRSVARDARWVESFLDGLMGLAQACGVSLAGGDTAESPGPAASGWSASAAGSGEEGPVVADIVLLGTAPAGQALRRSGARPGDILFCTGQLGGAAAELEALAAASRRFQGALFTGDHPHLFPRPRLEVGQALLRRGLATACIDLSDGLSTDLAHLCDASSGNTAKGVPMAVAAEVYAASLPLHSLAKSLPLRRSLAAALHGGEDYELLFTARPSMRMPPALAGVRLSAIGRILRRRPGEPQVSLISADGQKTPLPAQGWEHLR